MWFSQKNFWRFSKKKYKFNYVHPLTPPNLLLKFLIGDTLFMVLLSGRFCHKNSFDFYCFVENNKIQRIWLKNQETV